MTPTTISEAATRISMTVIPRSSRRRRTQRRSTIQVPHEEAVVERDPIAVSLRALALGRRLDVPGRVGRVPAAVGAVREDGRPARAGFVDQPVDHNGSGALPAARALVAHALT